MGWGEDRKAGCLRAGGAAAALLAVVAALAPSAATARSGTRPDLRVASVGTTTTSAAPGVAFRARDAVVNAGRGGAAASSTRFYLTRDVRASLAERRRSRSHPRAAATDVLLDGSRRVPPLRAGRRSPSGTAGTTVTVPAGVPSGRWFLLACADGTGRVPESREENNCRAAAQALEISGTSGPGGVPVMRAMSDVFEDEPDAVISPFLELSRPTICRPAARARTLTAVAAVRSAEQFLLRRAPRGMRKFRASAEHNDARRAVAAAAAAAAGDQPGAALAGLLRAHRLRPGDASILANAASMAIAVDLPNEAMAMLDRAAALDPPRRSPLVWHARLLIGRAAASAVLNRWADTERLAAAAAAAEPMLAPQAASLHAAVSLCRDDRAAAVARRKRSRRLQDPPPDPPIDESQGRASEMRNIPFPALPASAVPMAKFYQGLETRMHAELVERVRRDEELLQAERPLSDHPAAESRTRGIEARLSAVTRRPALSAIDRRFHDRLDESHDIRFQMFGSADAPGRYGEMQEQAHAACRDGEDYDACFTDQMRQRCRPVLRDYHQAWLNAITASYSEARDWYAQMSLAYSATASQLSDPARYERALLAIAGLEHSTAALIVQSASYWSFDVHVREHHCVEAPEPSAGGEPEGGPPPAGSGPCPRALQHATRTIDIASGQTKGLTPWSVGVSVNCDDVTLEGSIESIPWIKGFGAVSRNVRSGETTLVAGSKAEASKGPVKGSFESSLYVKFDPGGKVSDVGWRVGPSAAATTGLMEFGGGNVMDLSFISNPAPGGLPVFGGGR